MGREEGPSKEIQKIPKEIARLKELQSIKNARLELEESELIYRTIFENTGTAMIIYREDMTVLLVNTEFENLSGYSKEEVEHKMKWTQFVAQEDLQRMLGYHHIRQIVSEAVPGKYEFHLLDKKENIKDIALTVARIPGTNYTVVSFTDITERKKMEKELLKFDKLESLGILAGGIAHDFNNILMIITGNISLARMSQTLSRDLEDLLLEVENATRQAADLTKQLLEFARGGSPVKETVSIGDLLRESAAFALRGSHVKCEMDISDKLWTANIDKGQINQLVNNLIINAVQAMPDGGTIKIWAENTAIDSESIVPLSSGNYIKISIKDEGTGIPESNLSKIFVPYFTTKKNGNGLGLANCYSIVKKHDGYITLESCEGMGTTFHIYLPASHQQALEMEYSEESIILGRGRVLVMDDEAAVREMIGKMLHCLGYEADYASNGSEAVRLYQKLRESGQAYDAVIMDLTIPGDMGGKETLKRLMEIDPGVKAIISSGYADNPVLVDYDQYGFCGVIPKPYEIRGLNKVLSEVIVNRN